MQKDEENLHPCLAPDDEKLDFAVWLATGYPAIKTGDEIPKGSYLLIGIDGSLWPHKPQHGYKKWQPTKDWAQLGPLIERFHVGLEPPNTDVNSTDAHVWVAKICRTKGGQVECRHSIASFAACMAIAEIFKAKVPNEE